MRLEQLLLSVLWQPQQSHDLDRFSIFDYEFLIFYRTQQVTYDIIKWLKILGSQLSVAKKILHLKANSYRI